MDEKLVRLPNDFSPSVFLHTLLSIFSLSEILSIIIALAQTLNQTNQEESCKEMNDKMMTIASKIIFSLEEREQKLALSALQEMGIYLKLRPLSHEEAIDLKLKNIIKTAKDTL